MNDTSQSSSNSKLLFAFLWVVSLVFTGIVSYGFAKASDQIPPKSDDKVLSAQINQPANTQTPSSNNEVATVVNKNDTQAAAGNTNACGKNGFAQKWEYLTPYVIKANDSLQSIATDELKDSSRVNELLQINGVGPLVVGSTLYLPPPSIPKSSGNIRQVYGKLVEQNDTSWHISFTNDKSGQGLLIPSYLFTSVSNKDSFHIGDCLSVLFDDGYKIYSLSLQ